MPQFTFCPLSFTFPVVTIIRAAYMLGAKHARNTTVSSRLSTCPYSILPIGTCAISFFLIANFSSRVRPPALSRPSTKPVTSTFFGGSTWIAGSLLGRYHRSNFFVRTTSAWYPFKKRIAMTRC